VKVDAAVLRPLDTSHLHKREGRLADFQHEICRHTLHLRSVEVSPSIAYVDMTAAAN
jgi:hypothetical protein